MPEERVDDLDPLAMQHTKECLHMNFNLKDEAAIAQDELNSYLEAQVRAIAPRFKCLVPVNIKVERVGFTRNASRTPYIVYKVGDRRCCTFVKRLFFLELVQVLLKVKYSIEDRIRSITSSEYFGLSVETTEQPKYIPSSYINTFLERYNQVALEKTAPQQCGCNDLYDMCLHLIARTLHNGVKVKSFTRLMREEAHERK